MLILKTNKSTAGCLYVGAPLIGCKTFGVPVKSKIVDKL